jgi:hypothetical protein
MSGFVVAGCGDDESEGGGTTATGTAVTTQTGTGTPSGSSTGTGTPSGSSTGTGTTTMPTCAESCAAVMAADCDNGPQDMTGCQNGCAATEIYCDTEMAAAATCGGADPTYICTANGVPAVSGCETQYQAVVACLGAVVQGCVAECPDVVAAACSNGPPDVGSCAAGCAAATTECPTEYAAMVVCQGDNPTYECNANNVPRPVDCATEHDALMTCLNN